MATAIHDLEFIPGRGFMPARALGTPSNVVVEREGKTFTGGVIPDRDGVRVIFTVSGVTTDLTPGPYGFTMFKANARVVDDRGRVVAHRPRWTTGASLRFEGTPTLHWTLILERPAPDARYLEVAFDGPAGEWTVQLPLDPIDHEGIPGRSVEVTDHKLGITVAARAVARSADVTAVEIEGYLDPASIAEGWARRYVLGIGASIHSGGCAAIRSSCGTKAAPSTSRKDIRSRSRLAGSNAKRCSSRHCRTTSAGERSRLTSSGCMRARKMS